MKKIIKPIIYFCIAVSLLIGVFLLYTLDYYHADDDSITNFIKDSIVVKTIPYEGAITYKIDESEIGFIFYPGGKVEYTAYEPLMYELASKGITCVLVEMPFNLAVFNADAANKILDLYPDIEKWYIGGHSLGGSIAASYLEKNYDKFEGLVLLGSYSTSDLSEKDLEVLSIYGSEDLVMNKEKYKKNKENLPREFVEIIINGGCHAYFGMYGKQKKDGNPSIEVEEQISLTADYIYDFIFI